MEKYKVLFDNGQHIFSDRETLEKLAKQEKGYNEFEIPNIGDEPVSFVSGHGDQHKVHMLITRVE